MKDYSMNQLYSAIGISKQAVHQMAKRDEVFNGQVQGLIAQVDALRKEHPGCGVQKLYETIQPEFLGRDRFIEVFMSLGYGLKRKAPRHKTTTPGSYRFPNLIEGLIVDSPGQVWQTDITYIRYGDRFYYAVFILDVYTREIVGYNLSDSLARESNIKALKGAIKKHGAPQIHHSDRGVQYTSKEYLALLKKYNVKVSMSKIAQENAYAERVNRTIKEEYLAYWKPKSFRSLKRSLDHAVKHYNTKRQHKNLGKVPPVTFKRWALSLDQQDRPKVSIYAEGELGNRLGIEPNPIASKTNTKAHNYPKNKSKTEINNH